MGKRRQRVKCTSNGERPNVSNKNKDKTDKSLNIFTTNMRRFDSYINGKRAYITVPNPNPNNTKERWIKVLAKDHFNNTIGTSLEGTKYKDKFLMNRNFLMPNRPV